MNEVIAYEKEEQFCVITINRPEVRNALNMAVFKGLNEALDKAAADDDVRVLILAGAGKGFVAGADVNELLEFSTQSSNIGGWTASRFMQSVFTKLERIGKPSIAAIGSFCLGGGLELALSCTFRIASKTANIGFPELGLGIIPGYGGTERAVRAVGLAKAAELLLFHSIIDGEEAARIGIVNKAVDSDDVMPRAREWAQSLARLNPVAVRAELELLLHGQGSAIDQGLSLESALGSLAIGSEGAKQLLAKFLEKGK